MYLSNTTLFNGRCISSIYYIRYNYMFRRLTMAIFRLYMKYLVSSYTRLNMNCIQWGGRSWGGHEISYVSWRLGDVGTWVHLPTTNWTKYKKGAYYTGIKIFNFLPSHTKNVNETQVFKKTLKRFLLYNSFYSIDEYFNVNYDIYSWFNDFML